MEAAPLQRAQPLGFALGTHAQQPQGVGGAQVAHVVAAVAADRSLGIKLQDIQESDIAPTEPRGKDVDSASVSFTVQWFTPLGDHFTII